MAGFIHITVAILVLIALDHCVYLHVSGDVIDPNELQCNRTCLYTFSFKHTDCRNRDLSSIPSQCRSSVFLDFRRNDLQYLNSESLAGYVALRYLYLENNNIRNITPGAFTACSELRELFLQNNPLVMIQDQAFTGLMALRYLILKNTDLEIIEASAFMGLLSLERLFLSNNALRTLPEVVFHNLRTLQILILSNNQLQYLYREQFQGLFQLMHLDIQHNYLTRLQDGLFRGLPSLQGLNLSHNAISDVQEGALDLVDLSNLKTLDICHNNIISVRNFSNQLVGIQNVFFAGNPMYCDCENEFLMKWYRQNLQNNTSIMTDSKTDVFCHGPEELIGIPIRNISDDVIAGCKHRPKPISENIAQDDSKEILSIESLGSGELETTAILNNGGQVQAPVAQGKISDVHTKEESNVLMFIAIGGLLLCGAVIVFIVTVLYVKHRSRENSRRELEAQDKEKHGQDPRTLPMGITENPFPENEESDEEQVYEPIASMQEFQPRAPRTRLTSEKSTDSAYSEGSFLDSLESDDCPPPSHPPPPPPPSGKSISSLQECGYIPVFQNQNGKVYLCMQCPQLTSTGKPILMHSVSVPSQCELLHHHTPLSQSQPLNPNRNSFSEGYETQYVPSHICVDRCKLQHTGVLHCNAHPPSSNPRQDHLQDSPALPLEADECSYSQMTAMHTYPNTNPFASPQMTQSNPTKPRRVSFSNITTVHDHNE